MIIPTENPIPTTNLCGQVCLGHGRSSKALIPGAVERQEREIAGFGGAGRVGTGEEDRFFSPKTKE